MGIYDAPKTERYSLLGLSLAANASRDFKGPPGKKGIVRDIVVNVTTALVGTTSVPEIRVGSAANDSSFARWLLGTSAIAGYGLGDYRARSLCQNAQGRTGSRAMQLNDFANHIALEGNNGSNAPAVAADANGFAYLPADTSFFISGFAGVGTPAGVIDGYVDIDWI